MTKRGEEEKEKEKEYKMSKKEEQTTTVLLDQTIGCLCGYTTTILFT